LGDESERKGAAVEEKAGGPVQTTDAEIKPQVPPLIANLAWLLRHGRKHWRLVLVASLVVVLGWLLTTASGLIRLQSLTNAFVDFRIQRTVANLRLSYPRARESLSRGSGDFDEVDKDIKAILNLDPRNGHGLYYAGEVARIKHQGLFTTKSCPVGSAFASKPQPFDTFENDFARYLDERTAWIHHFLANDGYEEAFARSDAREKADRFRRALLIEDIKERLAALKH